jgi:hypothetical protein
MVKRCGKSAPRGREVCGRVNSPGCNFEQLQISSGGDLARPSRNRAAGRKRSAAGYNPQTRQMVASGFSHSEKFRQNPAYECHLSKRCLQRFERFLFALVAAPAPEAAVDVIFFKTAVGTFVMVDFVPVYVARKNAGVIIFRVVI